MSSMVEFKYFIPGENKLKYFPKENNALTNLRDKLLKIIEEEKSTYAIEIIWIDLAQLISNTNFNRIFNEISNMDIVKPKIFIGSQSITKLNKQNSLNHHKKINQLDNNICTYYISLKNNDTFSMQFRHILRQIIFNYKNELYHTEIVKEYYEYFTRMINNNHLKGGHSSQLLPMIFTSEQRMKGFAHENIKKIIKHTKSKKLDISILLVDDFGNSNLRTNKKNCKTTDPVPKIKSINIENTCSKGSVLYEILKEFTNAYNKRANESGEDNLNIKFDIKILDSANVNAIEKDNYFDIILLDYNFNTRESGITFIYELLDKLKKGFYHNGPFGKPWIIPISSFSNAFIDEMRNCGIHFIDERYKLSRGADFINTPGLFLYYFTTMISEIIEKGSIMKKQIDKIQKLITFLNSVTNWEGIEKNQVNYMKDFSTYIENKSDILHFINTNAGVLLNLKNNNNPRKILNKELNFYEQLLYNLAYRNYEGNEEIIIFHDLLKNKDKHGK